MKLNDKLRLAVVCVLATSAVAAYKVQTVPEMVKAANNLIVTLTPEQKTKMMYPFSHAERTNFHFTPGPWNGVGRQGLPLKAMTPDQTKLAHALLATGVSQRGYTKATTIMSLDALLKEIIGSSNNETTASADSTRAGGQKYRTPRLRSRYHSPG